ncbi:MAG: DUF5068 domain-containing protein [Aerococcaceae bacterium]|nr:DUF5068 domain-containing protein [Aerococcaceae bacterium]
MKKYIALLSLFCLAGCQQYEQFVEQQASQQLGSMPESQPESIEVDVTVVPEWAQLAADFEQDERIEIGKTLFETETAFLQEQQSFSVVVEALKVYEVTRYDEEVANTFQFDEAQKGAVIALRVAVTNTSDAPFYLSADEFRLSFTNAVVKSTPSLAVYPSQSGNLLDILSEKEGAVLAGETVEGYLVYGVGQQALEHIEEEGSFYVSVVPPRANASDLIGADVSTLGQRQDLFLPYNQAAARQLQQNASHIQDRLVTEWWGQKNMLITEQLTESQTVEGVTIQLNRIEIADFVPRKAYEEAFQTFAHGQIIVSVEYDVTNHSSDTVLPIDAIVSLDIAGDAIYSDYVMINQTYGQELAPGHSYKVIQSFALDKKRYETYWVNQPIQLTIALPTQSEPSTQPLTEQSAESQEEGQEEQQEALAEPTEDTTFTEKIFQFIWTPETVEQSSESTTE